MEALDCESCSSFRKSCTRWLTSLLVLLEDVLLDDVLLVEDDELALDSKSSIENPVEDELLEEIPLPDSRISIVKPALLEDDVEDDEVPPNGGGPPAPCGPPGPPWPPGPFANVLLKTY